MPAEAPPGPRPRGSIRTRVDLALAMLIVLLAPIVLAGSVGDPTPGGFVRFDDIRREAFTAVAVQRHHGDPTLRALEVRVRIIGDAPGTDYAEAASWLAKEANVLLVPSATGVPLYFTERNLIATSGAGAIGATVRSGMAVETIDERLAPCVTAHEVLHFLGLGHVDDPKNLMHARCSPGKLAHAKLDPEQKEAIDRLTSVTAVTPAGVQTWALRR